MNVNTARFKLLRDREKVLMDEIDDSKIPLGEITVDYLISKRGVFNNRKNKLLCELSAVRQCMFKSMGGDLYIDYKTMEYV